MSYVIWNAARDRGPFADEPRASDPAEKRREARRRFRAANRQWIYNAARRPDLVPEPPVPPFVDDDDRTQFFAWMWDLAKQWRTPQ